MNRSLRNLALLGLLAVGVSSAGAQTYPTLFNVTYTPANLTLTITSTGNAASGNLPNGTSSYSMGYGVLFKNLFTAYPDPIADDVSGELAATFSGGLKGTLQNTSALFSVAFDQFGGGQGLSVLNVTDNGSVSFNKADTTTSAFNVANSMTITFTSATASSYLPTISSANAGFVNVGLGAGIDIGSYSYTYSAVPEPSTYAAIAGALGLGYAVYRRRRQAAAATA